MSGVTRQVRKPNMGVKICGGQAITRRRYGGRVELKRSDDIDQPCPIDTLSFCCYTAYDPFVTTAGSICLSPKPQFRSMSMLRQVRLSKVGIQAHRLPQAIWLPAWFDVVPLLLLSFPSPPRDLSIHQLHL